MSDINMYIPDNIKKEKDLPPESMTVVMFITYMKNDEIKNNIESVQKKSLNYNIDLHKIIHNKNNKVLTTIDVKNISTGKTTKYDCITLGYYNNTTQEWIWMAPPKKMFELYNKMYDLYDLFGPQNKKLLETIFSSPIKITSEDYIVIPYFIKLLNANYNLIKFYADDKKSQYVIYTLIDLGIPEHFDIKNFTSFLSILRMPPSNKNIKRIQRLSNKKSKKKSKNKSKNKLKRQSIDMDITDNNDSLGLKGGQYDPLLSNKVIYEHNKYSYHNLTNLYSNNH